MRPRFFQRLIRRPLAASWRDEQGTQLIELALVIPVMLLLLGATAEFGRFFYTYSTLAKATRDGARYLISQPVGTADVAARNLVVYGNTAGTGTPLVAGLDASKVNIAGARNGGAAVQTTTVSIQNFAYVPVFNLGGLLGRTAFSWNVNAGSTMRQMVQ